MKTRILCCLFLLFSLLPAQDSEKKYLWPLTIENGVSSTFQEFRANHFHAGIDLRTFKKTGYPVLAIADGVIERIVMAKANMGRTVFLRHQDGNYSIYGHLEKFRVDIEAIVAQLQISRAEKYFGEYTLPNPIAVRQGEIIAFSGESGVGFPHLHLEIRDQADEALNPLSLIGNLPHDNYAPLLKGILLRSRGDTLLNNDPGEFYFKLHKNGPEYTLAEPVTVTGPFDLALNTFDLSDARHVVAPYSLEAFLDGRLYYQISFDCLSRDDNNQLGMLYDMAYSSSGAYFFNLFHQSGFALEKVKSRFAEAVSQLPPGGHELKIVVKDRQQNQATAIIPLRKLADPVMTIDRLSLDEGRLAIHFSEFKLRSQEQLRIKIYGPRGEAVYAGFIEGERNLGGQTVVVKGISDHLLQVLELEIAGLAGAGLKKSYSLQQPANGMLAKAEIHTYVNRDDVVVKINDFAQPAAWLMLKIMQGNQEQELSAREYGAGVYFVCRPLNNELRMQLRFILSDGRLPLEEVQRTLNVVYLKSNFPQTIRFGEFAADFGPTSVLEPTVLLLENEELPAPYPMLAGPVNIGPVHFTFLDAVFFKFKIPPGEVQTEQLGIFRYRPLGKRWSYVKTQADNEAGYLNCRVLTAGIFALLRDIYPPEIYFRKPRTRHLKQPQTLLIHLRDRGKGIDDRRVAVFINGGKIDCDYDPDWNRIVIDDPPNLKKGQNELRVQAVDFAGNLTEKVFQFSLK